MSDRRKFDKEAGKLVADWQIAHPNESLSGMHFNVKTGKISRQYEAGAKFHKLYSPKMTASLNMNGNPVYRIDPKERCDVKNPAAKSRGGLHVRNRMTSKINNTYSHSMKIGSKTAAKIERYNNPNFNYNDMPKDKVVKSIANNNNKPVTLANNVTFGAPIRNNHGHFDILTKSIVPSTHLNAKLEKSNEQSLANKRHEKVVNKQKSVEKAKDKTLSKLLDLNGTVDNNRHTPNTPNVHGFSPDL